MSKYIKAEVLKNNIHKLVWTQDMKSVEKFVDSLPAADVQEVRHGRWEHDGYDFPHGNDWVHCSVCGKRGINVPADLTPYCPNCGAKMDEEEER